MDSSIVYKTYLLLRLFSVSAHADDDAKCYDQLGCLDLGSPWKTLERLVPEPGSVEDIGTNFTLYGRYLNGPHIINQWPQVRVSTCTVNFNLPITVITHGFYASTDVEWVPKMKDAYLEKRNVNIILVDWRKGAAPPNYFQAASNTRVVAREITRVLRFFKERGAKLCETHCIGHSLGAHICGYVGKELRQEGTLIKECTGLDAAQPLFEHADSSVRLAKGDAQFVVALHTDAVPLLPFLGLGIMKEIGDVDFYFNGKTIQPGCVVDSVEAAANISDIDDITKVPFTFVADYSACNHGRSCLYYVDALRGSCKFWGQKLPEIERHMTKVPVVNWFIMLPDECSLKTCTPVGLATSRYPFRGAALVKTSDDEPFCDPKVAKKLWDDKRMGLLSSLIGRQ